MSYTDTISNFVSIKFKGIVVYNVGVGKAKCEDCIYDYMVFYNNFEAWHKRMYNPLHSFLFKIRSTYLDSVQDHLA